MAQAKKFVVALLTKQGGFDLPVGDDGHPVVGTVDLVRQVHWEPLRRAEADRRAALAAKHGYTASVEMR